jgi:hypothetical protein
MFKLFFVLCCLALLVACEPYDMNKSGPPQATPLRVYGPDKDGVKCYVYSSYGVSCVYIGVETEDN